MNYYNFQTIIFQGKLFQVHMQVQYSLPTSYSATGLITRSSKDTALNLTSALTEDILVELSILRPIPGLLFLAKKVVITRLLPLGHSI